MNEESCERNCPRNCIRRRSNRSMRTSLSSHLSRYLATSTPLTTEMATVDPHLTIIITVGGDCMQQALSSVLRSLLPPLPLDLILARRLPPMCSQARQQRKSLRYRHRFRSGQSIRTDSTLLISNMSSDSGTRNAKPSAAASNTSTTTTTSWLSLCKRRRSLVVCYCRHTSSMNTCNVDSTSEVYSDRKVAFFE